MLAPAGGTQPCSAPEDADRKWRNSTPLGTTGVFESKNAGPSWRTKTPLCTTDDWQYVLEYGLVCGNIVRNSTGQNLKIEDRTKA